MADMIHSVSMPQMISTITLRVRFARVAGMRLWLASKMMRVAGFVAGCDVEIDVAEDDGPGTWAHRYRQAGTVPLGASLAAGSEGWPGIVEAPDRPVEG